MYRSRFRTAKTLFLFALSALGACSTDSLTAPQPAPLLSRRAESPENIAQLAVCPTARSHRAEGVVGPAGGSLHAGGHRLTIPAGVLTEPTRLTLHAPAGRHVALELTAAGAEHYTFPAPVVVTISYDRCRRQHRPTAPLSAWYIDEADARSAERMSGKDDRAHRAVTFRTTHFSTYVVAY
jgi:hypothetical protein